MSRKTFSAKAILRESPDRTPTLEVVFEGAHAPGVAEQMGEVLMSAVRDHNPQILIVNLLGFEYVFGDDIGGALIRGLVALRKLGDTRPCRIVADGRTAARLTSLFGTTNLCVLFPEGLFAQTDIALASAMDGLNKSA